MDEAAVRTEAGCAARRAAVLPGARDIATRRYGGGVTGLVDPPTGWPTEGCTDRPPGRSGAGPPGPPLATRADGLSAVSAVCRLSCGESRHPPESALTA